MRMNRRAPWTRTLLAIALAALIPACGGGGNGGGAPGAGTPPGPLPFDAFLLFQGGKIAPVACDDPAGLGTLVTVTGLTFGETLSAIARRPQNGLLYGLGHDTGAPATVTLYVIAPETGVATPVGPTGTFVDAGGTPLLILGAHLAMDFNPTTDRVRVVTEMGQNFRINPNSGAFIDGDLGGAAGSVAGLNMDGPLNGASFIAQGVSYTNAVPSASSTTVYTIDAGLNALFLLSPPNAGTQSLAASIVPNITTLTAFDIPPTGTSAFIVGRTPGAVQDQFGVLDLVSGALTNLTTITAGNVLGLAVDRAPLTPAIALDATGTSLLRFGVELPGTTTTVAVTGVTSGEVLIGIDFRPSTGALYGLGVDETIDLGTLYRLDPQTGVATVIGTTGSIAFIDAAAAQVHLPNASFGYGFDFNPVTDRVRVTTGTGLSFRVNPTTGAPVDGDMGGAAGSVAGLNPDGLLNGGSTTAHGSAYTNSFGGATATTLYALDAGTQSIYIQTPPNAGTLTAGLPLLLAGVPLGFTSGGGFDIPANVTVAASNAAATTGSAVATLTVAAVTGVYRIDLATGAATFLGTLGSGAGATSGLALGRK